MPALKVIVIVHVELTAIGPALHVSDVSLKSEVFKYPPTITAEPSVVWGPGLAVLATVTLVDELAMISELVTL
jgi:hypothetical protein